MKTFYWVKNSIKRFLNLRLWDIFIHPCLVLMAVEYAMINDGHFSLFTQRLVWLPLPSLLFGIFGTVAGLLCLLLPETLGLELPDTVTQVEKRCVTQITSWGRFPHYWTFMMGICWWRVDFPHKEPIMRGQTPWLRWRRWTPQTVTGTSLCCHCRESSSVQLCWLEPSTLGLGLKEWSLLHHKRPLFVCPTDMILNAYYVTVM